MCVVNESTSVIARVCQLHKKIRSNNFRPNWMHMTSPKNIGPKSGYIHPVLSFLFFAGVVERHLRMPLAHPIDHASPLNRSRSSFSMMIETSIFTNYNTGCNWKKSNVNIDPVILFACVWQWNWLGGWWIFFTFPWDFSIFIRMCAHKHSIHLHVRTIMADFNIETWKFVRGHCNNKVKISLW